MQPIQRVCHLADHKYMNLEYICTFLECKANRFLCYNCKLYGIHKHDQLDNKHILNSKGFYNKIQNDLLVQKNSNRQQYNLESIKPLKQMIDEIQNRINNINVVIQQIETGQVENYDYQLLEEQLSSIQMNGFNSIDSEKLENLLNFHYSSDKHELLQGQANFIMKETQKIINWRLQLIDNNKQQKIKDAKYSIMQYDNRMMCDDVIHSGAISNDLRYVVAGYHHKQIKIWEYDNKILFKSIRFDDAVSNCKFTDDSSLLYVGVQGILFQFEVKNNFNQTFKQKIHDEDISKIVFISNTLILTSSYDSIIIKTDVNKNQEIFKIQANLNQIGGLDYNRKLDVIASGFYNGSIILWDGNGNQIINKQNAHNGHIRQVLFVDNNQLISLDYYQNIIIWNIDYETQLLEQQQQLKDKAFNISLVLGQKLIVLVGRKYLKICSIDGQCLRQFDHDVNEFSIFNTIQLESMKAVLILGQFQVQVQVQVLKLELE